MSCREIIFLDFLWYMYERGKGEQDVIMEVIVTGQSCVALWVCLVVKMLNLKIKLNQDKNSSCMESTNL